MDLNPGATSVSHLGFECFQELMFLESASCLSPSIHLRLLICSRVAGSGESGLNSCWNCPVLFAAIAKEMLKIAQSCHEN